MKKVFGSNPRPDLSAGRQVPRRLRYGRSLLPVIVSLSLSISGVALAAAPKLNWEAQLKPSLCGASGKPIISVHQKVLNDVDSGTGGNNWAFDNYEREIKVWRLSSSTYCATVAYEGRFQGVAGEKSPGNTAVLTGNERGSFEGGYRAIITGALLASPLWPTHGSVGTTDYKCKITDSAGACPGYVSWVNRYFSSTGFDYSWWGWIYHGGRYGTWVNAVSGNIGDIVPAKTGDKDGDNEKSDNDSE